MIARLREIGIDIDAGDPRIGKLVEEVKAREYDGYAYDGAEASFELLARHALESVPEYFRLSASGCSTSGAGTRAGELVTLSEATIKVEVKGEHTMTVAEGNGPVNALDNALRKALVPAYPSSRTCGWSTTRCAS